MGTRGMLAFAVDGRELITYNHYDSYPDGLGISVLHWLREAVKDPAALRASVASLRAVGDDVPPAQEDIARLAARFGWTAREHGGDKDLREGQEWYDLLHECQGDPGLILQSGYAYHQPNWPSDSLFCEWGYLIDLDGDGQFEVYRGFQRGPHDKGRFADRVVFPKHRVSGHYYPIALVASWPLTDLPSDEEFLAALREPGEDEED